ncbi:sulfate/molybdate ABC transporter ATP-binding protein [Aneurinibacillus aneurinilyticus]|jgi:sulfate transport system ATP-binding protein|uniref:sulfate/molybdate ABC transporter ATP-binding protein n=1 Tax=Aneurinibacillus aneurinilyticus TaxID=1391 RepID=UPI0023F2AC83|nr:sulfate ABC transporter ATP-binding protein [Aneurinibacillus aneurinilyticus]MCI1696700.1 sulfate ABC transporter ATP-binding protein [Aneurinibacillus aneurinilyticus]
MGIIVKSLSKTYGSFVALHDINLDIAEGELIALLGPSGSGKTTLLRIIGGMEVSDSGSVLLDNENQANKNMRDRHIGFVFQNYALFRHMTVFENVAFGLQVRSHKLRPSKKEIRSRVIELLKLVQLEGLEKRYPSQLSGGQRQRVALARALAIKPKVLLLDEPFGALDAKVRQELRRWLRKLHHELNITTIFVTHDQEEALEVADRIVVMNRGKIEQAGTAEDIYHKPAGAFVYRFLGQVNHIQGYIRDGSVYVGPLTLKTAVPESVNGQNVDVFVRPHAVGIASECSTPDMIAARVSHMYQAGSRIKVELEAEGIQGTIEAEVTEEYQRQIGLSRNQHVYITFRKAKLFGPDGKPIDYEASYESSSLQAKEEARIPQIS